MVAALVMLGGGQRSYRVLVPGLGRLTGERQQTSLVPGLPPQVLGVPTSPLLGATLLVAAAARLLPWRRAPRRSPTLVQFPPDAALEDERTKTEARRVLALLADDAAQQEPQELREAALALALLDFSRSAPSLSGAARLRTLKAAAQPLSVAKSLRKASTSGSRATKSTRTGSTLEEYSKLEAARDAVAGALLLAAGILADGFALEEEAAALRRLFNMPLEAERSERLRVSSARTAVRALLTRSRSLRSASSGMLKRRRSAAASSSSAKPSARMPAASSSAPATASRAASSFEYSSSVEPVRVLFVAREPEVDAFRSDLATESGCAAALSVRSRAAPDRLGAEREKSSSASASAASRSSCGSCCAASSASSARTRRASVFVRSSSRAASGGNWTSVGLRRGARLHGSSRAAAATRSVAPSSGEVGTPSTCGGSPGTRLVCCRSPVSRPRPGTSTR